MAEQCFSGTQYTGNGVRFRFDYLPCNGRQIFRCASINFAVKVFYDFGTAFFPPLLSRANLLAVLQG